jgi:predicted DNA-binding ribbon-helix-helix protein
MILSSCFDGISRHQHDPAVGQGRDGGRRMTGFVRVSGRLSNQSWIALRDISTARSCSTGSIVRHPYIVESRHRARALSLFHEFS